jgi:hypothetical protein
LEENLLASSELDTKRTFTKARVGVMLLALGVVLSAVLVASTRRVDPYNADVQADYADVQADDTIAPAGSNTGFSSLDCVSQVFIIRHGEKGNLIQTLTPEGGRRALYISEVFGTKFLEPAAIFARIPEPPKFVQREVLTVEPLAKKLNETIRQYHRKDAVLMADKILSGIEKRRWCSQLVLVAWEHSDIQKLVRALGKHERQSVYGKHERQSVYGKHERQSVYGKHERPAKRECAFDPLTCNAPPSSHLQCSSILQACRRPSTTANGLLTISTLSSNWPSLTRRRESQAKVVVCLARMRRLR